MLAGVSLTWYTWLEQGRRINASDDVLLAIGRALRLDEAGREHMLALTEQPFITPLQGPVTQAFRIDPGDAYANKGEVAARLATGFRRKAFVLAMGDDRTDEDLFGALPRSAWTIRVGTGSTTARFRLPGPRDVKRLLRSLTEV